METVKCPACGWTNFATRVVCDNCQARLPNSSAVPAGKRAAGGSYGQQSQRTQRSQRASKRWALNAALTSVAAAVVLLPIIFITTTVSTLTNPTQETAQPGVPPPHTQAVSYRYGWVLMMVFVVIWAFFYYRREE